MKTADEIKAITDAHKAKHNTWFEEYIINLCDDICKCIEKVASQGKTEHIMAIRNPQVAQEVINRFKAFGFTAYFVTTPNTNEITIAW